MTLDINASLAPLNNRSHVRGAHEPSLQHVTIPGLLRDAVNTHGEKEYCVFADGDVRLSYEGFAQRVDELALGFHALGLKKGDRLGLWSPNRLEWVLTQFATARIGVILVNINPAYRLSELEYALNKVGCKALVLADRFKSSDYLAMISELAPELASSTPGALQAARLPHLRSVIAMTDVPPKGMIGFNQMFRPAESDDLAEIDRITETLVPEDPINIQFTSGTTGQPKGATLSHFNIVNNARSVTDRIELTDTDRLCIPVPLYHCFGMVMGVLGVISKGATMVFPGEAFEPGSTLDTLAVERCTALYGVPTMFVAMLEALDQKHRDLSHLRTGIMAGSLCPVEIMRRVQDQMNMNEVTIAYGMTETSPVSFQSFTTDPLEKRCETVGRIMPHLEVKIVDTNGATTPVGVPGELCTKGYSVMAGYWSDNEKTADSIQDGWMHTGDLATLDENGFCRITGRLKDMIIRGGENIYPREIEEFLLTHPDIVDAQVFGVSDPKFGETVAAWVIGRSQIALDEEALRDFCKNQIAHYKIPALIRQVSEFPMTVTGKPQKFVMREQTEASMASGHQQK